MTTRADIDKWIMLLQNKLREFAGGDKSTFMGHAWKEPCRRVHRILLGGLTNLPMDKKKVLVIPEASLWYVPFSLLLDAEDRPFGADRVISLIPSAACLKFLRSPEERSPEPIGKSELLMFESVPRPMAGGSEDQSRQDRSNRARPR